MINAQIILEIIIIYNMDPFGENCSYRNPYRSSSCKTTYGLNDPYEMHNPIPSPMPRMSETMTLKGGKRKVKKNKTKRKRSRR